MAYNKRYNPDALPAHVEPEQAAAILGGSYQQQQQQQQPPQQPHQPPRTSSQNKPPAPLPNSALRPQPQGPDPRYGYSSYGPPPQQGGGSGGNSPRWDSTGPGQGRGSPRYGPGGPGGPGGPPPGPDPRYQDYGQSPPPQSYGYGRGGGGAPPPGGHGRPPVSNRPPPTPAPKDGNDREALWPLFRAVDKDGSGQLSERELRAALVNGDWSPFDSHTVKMMIRMFDADRSGSISFDEFCGLWGFLAAWRNLFDRFDVDRSGNISYTEFTEALVAFGYRLSANFVSLLFRTYDRRGEGAMSFDLFVQACISLKRMTDVFKKYDDDRDGYITLSFEEFLIGAQSLFLMNSISSTTDTGVY
ncbi:EF-hand [Trichodelitschia bisporula]|uniref:EF-hand n=1 Tax=Trichodelitschia bisporula TaxID=703511 RepID=A0A6G1I6J2_9PEZI|nr:EF-hand [Trichodelitschia bisporula]